MNREEEATWPDALRSLFERVRSIPANDELELRVAVHDLQSLASQHGETYEQFDSAILDVCSDIIRRASHHIPLEHASATLDTFHSKPYIRSINALVRTLLQELELPKRSLCLDTMKLQQCALEHIDLDRSSLRMVDLSYCKLSRASLAQSNLQFSNMMSASMNRVNLSESRMEHCEMGWCDLSNSDLHRCQLIGADLGGSILDHTDLSQAILSGANLSNASLNHADLTRCNLFGANLQRAKLYACDLSGTGITTGRLDNAAMDVHADESTIWGNESDCAGRNPLDPAYYVTQHSLL